MVRAVSLTRACRLFPFQDPVLTNINFIVPLNGMIYSTRLMSNEILKFATSVRDLVNREKGYYKRKKNKSSPKLQ